MFDRVFLIVMDSFGVGELPDAEKYGDKGSNTLGACLTSLNFKAVNLKKLGLYNIDGLNLPKEGSPIGCFGKMAEKSNGKDTTIGHWEIAGIVSEKPFDTFPNGFPEEILAPLREKTGRNILCNKPYSGTEVIKDYGLQHEESGDLIVYTSADSVLQIATHEEKISLNNLYSYCEIAREILNNSDYNVGRVIARPFVGSYPNYQRTANRHDYSVVPPEKTILDYLSENGLDVISVGKINDIFCGCGITESYKTKSNDDGMNVTLELTKKEFKGLCFVNLVEFDSVYGHRNDIDGYAQAVSRFDVHLGKLMESLSENDLLIITADHGCDPSTLSTDHSREYVPILAYGKRIKGGINLGVRNTFADISKTVLENFEVKNQIEANSFIKYII